MDGGSFNCDLVSNGLEIEYELLINDGLQGGDS